MDPMSTDKATAADQEYLETLFWRYEAGLPMTGANIARAMQLSPPTVHEMVGRLERDGYITRDKDRTIAFTPSGATHAEEIVRRHRQDLPARPPDRGRRAARWRPAGRRRGRCRRAHPALRERGRGPAALP